MSHLLAIAVGPVQEFIAAARRTRDLWFGSYLLSEISKAVAKSVQDQIKPQGQLIFPSDDADLTPGNENVNVANIILAELRTGVPKDVAAKAKEAANQRWLEFADEARRIASRVIRQEIWDDQVNDVIEFYAAWVARSEDYRADHRKLRRLLAGRKNCRDFLPANGRAGVPKSSLDGQRESVLKPPAREAWSEGDRARLRIRDGEQLDVVGAVKRVAEKNPRYPSVSRVAADPWVRGHRDEPAFAALMNACQELSENVLYRLNKEVFPQFDDFPFEGTAVYISRHREWGEEIGEGDRFNISAIRDALKRLPDPNPYLAVLVADGDKMGAAISELATPEKNRKFSSTLAGFADSARTIVNAHNGVLVYAGGDDVLAFLPVDTCLSCARKLHDDFGIRLAEYGNPTLSVGIAIGHFMENLEDLLEYGRAAEKAAKKVEGKDALAVHLHKRGGAPTKTARRWKHNPDKNLTLYAELMQKEALPSKLPYDLHKLAAVYEATGWKEEDRIQALRQDALRIVADKQPRAGKAYMPQVREIIKKLSSVTELKRFCDELLVARSLCEVFEQAKRQPTELTSKQKEGAA